MSSGAISVNFPVHSSEFWVPRLVIISCDLFQINTISSPVNRVEQPTALQILCVSHSSLDGLTFIVPCSCLPARGHRDTHQGEEVAPNLKFQTLTVQENA